jgi:serine phosphatase RsbU (regulator of sigma subunit)
MTTERDLFAEIKPRRLEGRTLWLWALANSVAGLGIGAAILLFADATASTSSLIPMSVVFANVVGFVAVLTVRYVIPRYSGLPAWVRYPLAVLTLIGGGVFGSAVTILVNPLIVFYQVRLALMVVSVNGVLALIVGFLTFFYEHMRHQIEREASERGRLEQEMTIARDIQMELLPRTFPRIPGLDMFAFTVPARHVGGDCYDVIDIGDGRLAVTIGDVSGKGTPAAILMANVQAAVRALSESGVPGDQLITRVNRLVHTFTEESAYITFFYCVLDTRTGDLSYVNAGHNPPCIFKADGSKEYLDRGGLLIGIVPGAEYEEGHTVLAPGDDLVLYTDGITEAANAEDEMFGEERLEALLTEHRHASAREIEERVYSGIRDFVGTAAQSDDLTMVVVKLVGKVTDDDSVSSSDSPKKAKGGPPAARGTPRTGDLRGPAAADRAECELANQTRHGWMDRHFTEGTRTMTGRTT